MQKFVDDIGGMQHRYTCSKIPYFIEYSAQTKYKYNFTLIFGRKRLSTTFQVKCTDNTYLVIIFFGKKCAHNNLDYKSQTSHRYYIGLLLRKRNIRTSRLPSKWW